MLPIILISPKFLRWFTRGFAIGITIFPFVIFDDETRKADVCLVRHEQIHIYQQLELLVIPFYIWYLVEYGIHRLRGKDHNHAYRDISFEREARYLQDKPEVRRRWFGFLKYVG